MWGKESFQMMLYCSLFLGNRLPKLGNLTHLCHLIASVSQEPECGSTCPAQAALRVSAGAGVSPEGSLRQGPS